MLRKVSKQQVEKMIEKLNIHDIKPSSRRYPAIILKGKRSGDQILNVENFQNL